MKNFYPEDEAKQKWCPLTQGDIKPAITNRKNASPTFNCIGSCCMMWQWFTKTEGYCGLNKIENFFV